MAGSETDNDVGIGSQEADTDLYAFPCSLAQARFWILDRITPEDPALNVAVRWRLRGRLDAGVLQQALNAVIDRHEILRTSYRDVDGEPEQLVHPAAPIQLPVIDLTLLPEAGRHEERDRISQIEARKPFDLTQVPNLRATLLKVEAEEHIVLVTVHHIASDGWSMGIIARDMMEFYQARLRARTPKLADLPLQYADFAVWQSEWMKADALKNERVYWTSQLAGFKRFDLPADKVLEGTGTAPAFILGRQLPRTLTDTVSALATAEGCTFFMVGAAALMCLLHRRSGCEDITVGTQIAGRDRVELNDIVGPFINTVPLRARITGNPSFRQLLAQMHDVIEGALLNQRMPIEDIIAIAKPVREPGRNPLFSVNLICQRSFISTDERPELSLIDMPSVSPGALYDLNFFFVERPDGWRISCEYDTSLYNKATVEGYLAQLQDLLGGFVADLDRPVGEVGSHAPLPAPAQQSPSVRASEALDSRVRVEAELAEIWVNILKVPILSVKDNFFALGGHSLSAFRMLSRLEKVFGKRISFDDLQSHPTIGELAKLLGGPVAPEAKAAVVMQPHGASTPIFALHDTFIFQELVNHLGQEQPFISVPLPTFVEGEAEISQAEMVEHCVRIIEEERPNGPYILLGFCAAARLNVAIARRLIERGHAIELFVTLDAWAPGYSKRQSRLKGRLGRFSYQIQSGLYYARCLLGGAEQRRHALRRIRLFLQAVFGRTSFGGGPDEDARIGHWVSEAGRNEDGRPLPMPILTFHNENMPLGYFLDRTMGWSALTSKGVTMVSVAATHEELIRRNASRMIGDVIRATLKQQSGH
ncbi:condensation domain-containing protein [Labrys sp. KB_33_2]|uniref:condensation domain-containing protein n=1 Tax=Labrys sp. KB_33_2 TaxID=3237479 RepID=UPI003F8E2C29